MKKPEADPTDEQLQALLRRSLQAQPMPAQVDAHIRQGGRRTPAQRHSIAWRGWVAAASVLLAVLAGWWLLRPNTRVINLAEYVNQVRDVSDKDFHFVAVRCANPAAQKDIQPVLNQLHLTEAQLAIPNYKISKICAAPDQQVVQLCYWQGKRMVVLFIAPPNTEFSFGKLGLKPSKVNQLACLRLDCGISTTLVFADEKHTYALLSKPVEDDFVEPVLFHFLKL